MPSNIDLVERERYLFHKNKKILVHDYSGLNGNDAIRVVAEHSNAVIRRGLRGELMLVDVSNAYANREVLEAFKKNWSMNSDYFQKVAVVGATGVVRFFLDIVNRFAGTNALAFDTEGEALDWLID